MDTESLEELKRLHTRGATILFARGHRGDAKIKVQYSPMGLRKRRYRTDEETYQAIKAFLREASSGAAET